MPLPWEEPHRLSGILCRRFVSSSCLLICAIIHITMDSWVFIFTLCIITQRYFIYFVPQIVPALATGTSFSWPRCPFDLPIVSFPSFPALGDAAGLPQVLPMPGVAYASPGIRRFSGSHGCFHGGGVTLETKSRVLGVPLAKGVLEKHF